MKALKILVLSLLFISSCVKDKQIYQEEKLSQRSLNDLCMVTYNTALLDSPWFFDLTPQCEGEDCIRRAEEICRAATVENPDIISFQEVWQKCAIDELKACLIRKGYNVIVDENCDGTNIDPGCTGLMIASKLPILKSEFIHFPWFTESSWDKFKDKGFLKATIQVADGCVFDIINTHLQAEITGDAISGRLNQINWIRKYIDPNTNTVLMGDFNIKPGTFEYKSLLSLGKDVYSIIGGTTPITYQDGSTYDYFLIKDPYYYGAGASDFTINYAGRVPNGQYIKEYYISITCKGEETIYGPYESNTSSYFYEILAKGFRDGCNVKIIENEVFKQIYIDRSDHYPILMCGTLNCRDIDESDDTPFDYTLDGIRRNCFANGCSWNEETKLCDCDN